MPLLRSDSGSFLPSKNLQFLQFQVTQGKFPKVLKENDNNVYSYFYDSCRGLLAQQLCYYVSNFLSNSNTVKLFYLRAVQGKHKITVFPPLRCWLKMNVHESWNHPWFRVHKHSHHRIKTQSVKNWPNCCICVFENLASTTFWSHRQRRNVGVRLYLDVSHRHNLAKQLHCCDFSFEIPHSHFKPPAFTWCLIIGCLKYDWTDQCLCFFFSIYFCIFFFFRKDAKGIDKSEEVPTGSVALLWTCCTGNGEIWAACLNITNGPYVKSNVKGLGTSSRGGHATR